MGTLESIHRYPLKSCHGERLDTALVEPWGLAGDRRWMLVDDDGKAITARESNRLVLLRPQLLDGGGLRVGAPGLDPLDIAPPDPRRQTPVSLFASDLTAAAAGSTADDWFTSFTGRSVRLVWLDDPERRPTDPLFGLDSDRVSFADGYPVMLASRESLTALNAAIVAADPSAEPVGMSRFRPNLVVRGQRPWAEDDWRRVRIGEATFRVVRGCDRCVITTIDPLSAQRGREPMASLARIRRYGRAVWFGSALVCDTPDAKVSLGDDVEVLDAVPPGHGPLRGPSRGALLRTSRGLRRQQRRR